MKEQKINIAIVDDHTLFRNGLAALMNEFDELNVIFSAGNGIEMQEMLAKSHIPDIILMDINMPVMDGISSTKAIRRLGDYNAEIPIIALTASLFSNELETITECGMNGFVIKPFVPNELYNKIKPYLRVKPSN